ncbi:wd40 repeat-containing protein : G-protein beta WD-40 repeats containing protein, putative OS=Talaromyces stipitatus (strain ATCC 10500 / CBS 375.48 / QM 6759 / NRRL 1006) GN=TSTA_062310 PE=4 SV=1: WD40: WD40: WD40 [Gemmata massiliana]|uniref:Uncharacterized protein n=1 Tax=Gemmata massiliana TaxID=1210884 RepID=A0A6P2D406_9BACT|nr:WD40 repeat domain-containing protein [Gemmata massiliana]VTR95617.1 wd40 repeat-containing protein : G-protein beta WD-40 repeats containing protein, putative OS=Talaromyces stipitatus (strain ATCC 10500 / CBS 375.48 / QM 6759 / NRRL 1006) GN=TSTA_062310 PE=4 SV=1: WD40: WD40: WD40 [Gemmata massiliana]
MLLFEAHKHETPEVTHKAVVSIAFSPDGSTFATGGRDGTVLVRDAGGNVASLLKHSPKVLPVHAVGFQPNGTGLVSGGAFGWMIYRRGGEKWREFASKLSPVTSLAVLNDRIVAIGTGDRFKASSGALELWDTVSDRKIPRPFPEPNGVRAVAASPKNKLVAWATGHRKVRVWDITTPNPTDFPQERDCPALALSTDGSMLATAGDWNAKIYDLKTKRERVVLKGHKGQVLSVAFSPDGSTVATGSFDSTVRLWDTATGKERANYQWDIGVVHCVTYAPDGFRLAAGGDSGRVVVWDTE